MLNGTITEAIGTNTGAFHLSKADGHTAANVIAALELAAAGIPVFPATAFQNLRSVGWQKRPLIHDWQQRTSTDLDQVERWWHDFPSAVPGIELGRARLVVIDTDRHPGGADGVVAFATLEVENGGLPPHPQTNTAGGGNHHIFSQPEGETFGNRSGELPDGIDVRGAGGWIVAPGAIRSDGAMWQLAHGAQSLAEAYRTEALHPLPSWICAFIQRSARRGTDARRRRDERKSASRETAYAATALKELTNELSRVRRPGRNNALNAAAYRMGGMVGPGWIDRSDVADALRQACVVNGLVADDGEHSVQLTLASGLSAGAAHPHSKLSDRPGRAQPAHSTDTPSSATLLSPMTLKDLLELDIRPREFVIEPLIHERGLVMAYAWRGVGKTWFALGLGYAIAAGASF